MTFISFHAYPIPDLCCIKKNAGRILPMETANAAQLFNEAREELFLLNREIYQPGGACFSFLVCPSVKESIDKLLTSFLLQKGRKAIPGAGIFSKYEQCVKLDESLSQINIRSFHCCEMGSCEDASLYCSSTEKVKRCLAAARKLTSLVSVAIYQ